MKRLLPHPNASSAALVRASIFAAVFGLSACSKPPADNILFVSFDTTRADHISAYGYEFATTPNVDALARSGVLFERAFSHVPSTLPSHTSMFTGLLPPEHGVRCNGWYQVPLEHETLAETLKGQGFATGAVIGAFPLDNRFGLDQGFGSYDARFSASDAAKDRPAGVMDAPGQWRRQKYLDFERAAVEVTDQSIVWLDSRRGAGRWFLFAHYFDAHYPYEPSAQWAERFASPYDAELAYADHHFGRLLEYVDKLPGRTLIVFTADHGESLGEHGEARHSRFVYDATLHVPLVIRLEGKTARGHRVATNVSHVDLHPTVLELLGVKGPVSPHGRSLVPALTGGEPEPRDIYSETLVWALEMVRGISVRALIRGEHKWVRTDRKAPAVPGRTDELYHLRSDPAELTDPSPGELPTQLTALRDRLDEWSAELEAGRIEPDTVPLDDVTKAKLQALGYLGD